MYKTYYSIWININGSLKEKTKRVLTFWNIMEKEDEEWVLILFVLTHIDEKLVIKQKAISLQCVFFRYDNLLKAIGLPFLFCFRKDEKLAASARRLRKKLQLHNPTSALAYKYLRLNSILRNFIDDGECVFLFLFYFFSFF